MAFRKSLSKVFGPSLQRLLVKHFGYRLVKEEKYVYGRDVEETITALLRHVKPKNVVDVGSNDGKWMYALSQMSGRGLENVFMFEPQKKYAKNLKSLDLGNADKRVFCFGVSSKKEVGVISGGTASASYLPINETTRAEFTGIVTEESEKTELYPLDSIREIETLPTVDLLKIDVQGLELEVLKGATSLLKKTRFIVLEASWNEYYAGQAMAWQVLELLHKSNFQAVDFGYHWRVGYDQTKRVIQSDIVFMNIELN